VCVKERESKRERERDLVGEVGSNGEEKQRTVVLTTRWASRASLVQNFERNVTKFAQHKDPKLIAEGKLSFDERVVVYRVDACVPGWRGWIGW